MKALRCEVLRRWLLPRLPDLWFYSAFRLDTCATLAFAGLAFLLWLAVLALQLPAFLLRRLLVLLSLRSLAPPLAAALQRASAWSRR